MFSRSPSHTGSFQLRTMHRSHIPDRQPRQRQTAEPVWPLAHEACVNYNTSSLHFCLEQLRHSSNTNRAKRRGCILKEQDSCLRVINCINPNDSSGITPLKTDHQKYKFLKLLSTFLLKGRIHKPHLNFFTSTPKCDIPAFMSIN